MPNQPAAEKTKVSYAEYEDVREELAKARIEMTEREGREITEAELYRSVMLKYANARLKARGAPLLKHDPATQFLGGTYAKGTERLHRRKAR